MFGGLGAIAAAGVAFLFGYRGNAATKEIAMMAATADQGQGIVCLQWRCIMSLPT